MFRGIANLNLVADDMDAAVEWYAAVFGAAPYFVRPEQGPVQYAEWRFGDDEDEFALMDARFRPALPQPGGALVSMHVDDIQASFDRLLALGAKPFDPVTPRGEGWWCVGERPVRQPRRPHPEPALGGAARRLTASVRRCENGRPGRDGRSRAADLRSSW